MTSAELRLAVIGLLATVATSASASDVEAIWHRQSVKFDYVSRSQIYACETLAQKVILVLGVVGARDVRVENARCQTVVAGDMALQITSMLIQFVSPMRSTPAARAEATRDEARARLLERLGVASPPLAPFLATFRDVDLGARSWTWMQTTAISCTDCAAK